MLKKKLYIGVSEKLMAAVKVKPVQPTEIKDKKIVREVITQIRKPIPAAALKRHKEQEEAFLRLLKK